MGTTIFGSTTRRLALGVTVSALMVFAVAGAQAQNINFGEPLSDKGISDFNFPESETTLNGWIFSKEKDLKKKLYQHAWGIWTALTRRAGPGMAKHHAMFKNALVYQTWLAPSEIVNFTRNPTKTQSEPKLVLAAPNQFPKVKKMKRKKEPFNNIHVTVNYSPEAARHALTNKLFLYSTLKSFAKNGYREIPLFPYRAVTIKPVYHVIHSGTNRNRKYYRFPSWPGVPIPAKTFGSNDWQECFFIDVTNQSKGDGTAIKGCNPKDRTPGATYNLNDFIHVRVTKKNAGAISSLVYENPQLKPGDNIILVAMHVTTRETLRWVWQSFWWTTNPKRPHTPSSPDIVAARPPELKGAPAHYAGVVAYQQLYPAQPITGGENVGSLVPGFNPYLEAGFAPSTFPLFRAVKTPEGIVTTKYGVESNCMTCHGAAYFDPGLGKLFYGTNNNPQNRQFPYAADFYLDRDDPLFDGRLKLDFAWSILGNMVLD